MCARTRGHYKNDTLTIQIMKAFEMVFTTRHRNGYAVERDCTLIDACVTKYTTNYKYMYDGKNLIMFYVYDVDKKARIGILTLIFERLQSLTYYQSLDLQSYTKE